jgi:twitching motility two-component system response regulator PilH
MAKILLVDDSLTDRTLLRKILESRNYQILEVEQSEFVVELVRKEKPDVILLDIVMPGVNGYEICRHLKRSEDTQSIPIVFISSRAEASDIYWGKLQGADEYLTKPIDPQVLFDVVERMLSQSQDVNIYG